MQEQEYAEQYGAEQAEDNMDDPDYYEYDPDQQQYNGGAGHE